MERMLRFGPDARLVGILGGAELPPRSPIVVLPSAGLVPRAGPFRLHVEMARRLVGSGLRTFRFDLPGVGEAPRNGLGRREATLAALECLAGEFPGARFAIGGICSAADLGWAAALANRSVSAVMMLDGLCHTGPWFLFARIRGAARRGPRHWLGVVRRRLPGRVRVSHGPMDLRDWPTLGDSRGQMQALLARGVRFLCIYSGGIGDYFLDARQFHWTFGRASRDSRVVLHHWPDCDHTYFARGHRERLLETVGRWLVKDVFPERAGCRT